MFRFHEICDSVLDPKALTFLTENAPAYAIASYRVRQHQLAQLSLRLASDTVLYDIAGANAFESSLSIRNMTERSISKVTAVFLVIVCSVGRTGLWIFQFLRLGVPRRIQFWVRGRV